MQTQTLTPLLVLMGLAGSVSAQSFNVDLEIAGSMAQGDAGGTAATTQTGLAQGTYWNVIDVPLTGTLPATPLLNDSGDAGCVTMVVGGDPLVEHITGGCNGWGADEIGLFDGLRFLNDTLPSSTRGIQIDGLVDGDYKVFVYAKRLDGSQAGTIVTIDGVSRTIDGDCPDNGARFQVFKNFVRVDATVANGSELKITLEADAAAPFVVSGLQIVRLDPFPVGEVYCINTANSTGAEAQISASVGSPRIACGDPIVLLPSVAANDLRLKVINLPNSTGQFYYGPQQILAPLGNGFRCVGGQTCRLSPILTASGNEAVLDVDYASLPSAACAILPGDTWNFQYWYRDPFAANGTTFNLSDAIEFQFAN